MPFAKTEFPELDRAYDLLWTHPETALTICNDFLKDNPDNQTALRRKLFALDRLQKWSEALGVARQMIDTNPQDSSGYIAAAEMHYRLGDYADTVAHAHRALALDDDKWLGTGPYRYLALCHAHAGDLDNALSYAKQAEAADPGKWFQPSGPLPAGTPAEFDKLLKRLVVER